MNKRMAVASLLMLQALSFPVHAVGNVAAKVIAVRTDSNGWGMVMFDQNVVGTPASCRHSAYLNALAFDSNTPAGRAFLASALAAKATGSTMHAYGTGQCAIYGSWVEDLEYSVNQ